jgi:hypothetical protein
MKSLKTKLALSALAVAVLATPAFAQRVVHRQTQDYSAVQQVERYPNGGAGRTGTAESFENGNEFNLGQ